MSRHVANKFYVDAIVQDVKNQIGDRHISKENGVYVFDSTINMRNNQIINLPNPEERYAAANKNYVDNGGAIIKNPDGSFSAVTNVNLQGFSLKNAATPESERDLVTKSYVDEKVSPIPFILERKPIISVCAEENGSIEDGNYEFSFGNGNSGVNHGLGGYCMSVSGRIIRGSLMVVKDEKNISKEVKVNIVVDGIEPVDYSIIKKKDESCSCVVFPKPLEIKQCGVINFISRSNNTNVRHSYITILIELDL